MTGLVRFLAATPTLSGALDFTDMSALEYIECYGAQVSSVDLTGLYQPYTIVSGE